MDDLKARFLRVYANMPLSLRDEVVVLLGDDDEPVTWRAAFIEINSDADRSQPILEKLSELGII